MVMITKQQFNEILNSVRHLKFVSFRYLKFEGEGRFEFNGSFKIETLELAGLSYNNKDYIEILSSILSAMSNSSLSSSLKVLSVYDHGNKLKSKV